MMKRFLMMGTVFLLFSNPMVAQIDETILPKNITYIKFLSSVLTWDNIYPLMSVKTKFGTFIVDSVEANEKGLITLKVKK